MEITHIKGGANTFMRGFLVAQNPQHRPNTKSVRAVRWIPPIFPHYKVNFDGACFTTEGTAGMGAIIRDASGKVSRAIAQQIKNPISAATVEALACRRAMILAKDEGVLDCIFEGDAETIIIKAILASDLSHPKYGHVINDILQLSIVFSYCSFYQVKRLGNSVAHFLAGSSKSSCEL